MTIEEQNKLSASSTISNSFNNNSMNVNTSNYDSSGNTVNVISPPNMITTTTSPTEDLLRNTNYSSEINTSLFTKANPRSDKSENSSQQNAVYVNPTDIPTTTVGRKQKI